MEGATTHSVRPMPRPSTPPRNSRDKQRAAAAPPANEPAEQPGGDYHHGDLRNALLLAAAQRLADQGHAEFSLSDLARGVGVTPAAVYKHFADKSAVMSALAALGFERLTASFEMAAPQAQAARDAADARRRLERIAQAYHDFGVAHPALFRLMFGEAGAAHRRAATAGRQENSPSFAYLGRAMHDLRSHGPGMRVQRPDDLWLAWSAIHGATHLAMAGLGTELAPPKVGRTVVAAVMAALSA
jgi:AcrR family transcriptional regulator